METDQLKLNTIWNFYKSNAEQKKFPLETGIVEYCRREGIDFYSEYDDLEQVFIDNDIVLKTWAGLTKGKKFNSFDGFGKDGQRINRKGRNDKQSGTYSVLHHWWLLAIGLLLGILIGHYIW